jgi:hypothetical protein
MKSSTEPVSTFLDSGNGRFKWLSDLLIAALIGGIGFLLVTGGKIIWPSNIDWLMTGEDDGGTHYLGWEFYRNAPLLQWPYGANPDYGMEISSSIVFSDSLPLFAMALKPFSSLLPRPFQYLGIWLLTCFVLQAFFSARLLGTLGVKGGNVWLGTIFFVMAPSFLFRISASHYAGSAHWIVLAALAIYFEARRSLRGWMILLCVATLVNIYLAVMAGVIYAADLTQRLWRRESGMIRTLTHAALTGILLLFTMYSAGYFMAGKYTAGEGYGYYRLNLLAPLLPMGNWSRWFPSPEVGAGDFEGFNYLGTGVIGLLCLAILLWLRSLPAPCQKSNLPAVDACPDDGLGGTPQRAAFSKSRWAPIFMIFIGCTLFGISNRIAAGSVELWSFDLPAKLWPIFSSFRSSGRFFLPVYCMLLAAGIGAIGRRTSPTSAGLILCGLLGLQIIDISQGVWQLRQKLNHAPLWTSPLKSDFWSGAGKQYQSLVVTSPAKHYVGFLPLVLDLRIGLD